jgi:ribosomal protein L15
MKHYNKDALRGGPTTDQEWQAQMAEVGVNIPDELLNSAKGVHYAMNEIKKLNIADLSKSLGEVNLAKTEAEKMYKAASKEYDKLLKSGLPE